MACEIRMQSVEIKEKIVNHEKFTLIQNRKKLNLKDKK